MSRFARRFGAALRGVTQLDAPQDAASLPTAQVTTLLPLAAIVVGLWAATVYGVGSHLWPTSVAVVVSMLATGPFGTPLRTLPALVVLLVKYNTLMALSASTGPLALTPELTLGLIMIAGHAAGGALLLHDLGGAGPQAESGAARTAYVACLALGLAPAVLLGMPGLVGLATAIVTRMALGSAARAKLAQLPPARPGVTRLLCETAFYLGALTAWRYV